MTKIIVFLKFIFYLSLVFLIVLSLYPGSLLGLFFYQDLSRQPNLIENPFGTSINHFFSYFLVSILGFFLHKHNINFKRLVFLMLLLSITLELLQFLVPIRAFQFYDLIGNILGVLAAYFLVKIYLLLNKK